MLDDSLFFLAALYMSYDLEMLYILIWELEISERDMLKIDQEIQTLREPSRTFWKCKAEFKAHNRK